jgi:hypothetical protein
LGTVAQENPGVETLRSTAVLPRAVIRVESTIRTWEFALSLELRWGGCCRGCTQRSMIGERELILILHFHTSHVRSIAFALLGTIVIANSSNQMTGILNQPQKLQK